MNRRTFLASAGTVAAVATTGCLDSVSSVTSSVPYDVVSVKAYCLDQVAFEYNADFGETSDNVREQVRPGTDGYGPRYYEDDDKPEQVSLHLERLGYEQGAEMVGVISVIEDFNGEYDWRRLDFSKKTSPVASIDVSADLTG